MLFAPSAAVAERTKGRIGRRSGPYFRSTGASHEAKVHERVTFDCDVGNLGKNVITWYNVSSGRIIFAGSVNIIGDDRLRIGDEGRRLHLGDVGEFDSGVYKCQVEVRSRPLVLEHKLNVLGKNNICSTNMWKRSNHQCWGLKSTLNM